MIAIESLKISHKGSLLVDISLQIKESLALIGASGSGKSLTLKALLGMLPQELDVHLDYSAPFKLKAGETLGFVPQNPFTALSPLTKIKKQFFAPKARVEELFGQLGLSLELLERFSPELSGGQLQRVVIAMALEHHPKLLLLDEPTTALDPDTKRELLLLLGKLSRKEAFAMLFVTHDIMAASSICREMAVIEKGKIVEYAESTTILQAPKEAYTKELIAANFATRDFRK